MATLTRRTSSDGTWAALTSSETSTSSAVPQLHFMRRLVAGAVVVAELRAQVTAELGYTCSGGIAANKLLAKVGCGLHKPNKRTLVFPAAVPALLGPMPIDRLQGLGGNLGTQVKEVLARELQLYSHGVEMGSSSMHTETTTTTTTTDKKKKKSTMSEKTSWLRAAWCGISAESASRVSSVRKSRVPLPDVSRRPGRKGHESERAQRVQQREDLFPGRTDDAR